MRRWLLPRAEGPEMPLLRRAPDGPKSCPRAPAPLVAVADPAAPPRLAYRVFRLARYTQRWCFLSCKKFFGFFFFFGNLGTLPGGLAVLHSRSPHGAAGRLSAACGSCGARAASSAPCSSPCAGVTRSTRLLPPHLWERGGLLPVGAAGSTQGWWSLRVGSEVARLCPRGIQVAACGLPGSLLTCSCSQLPPCLCPGAVGKSSRCKSSRSCRSGVKGRAGFNATKVRR